MDPATEQTPAPRLGAHAARVLLRDERAVKAAERALEKAKEKRDATRERYAAMVPLAEQLEVGGVRIKRIEKTSGHKFRLGKFLEKHKLTKAMQPFVTEPVPYEVWFVKAVEPEKPA